MKLRRLTELALAALCGAGLVTLTPLARARTERDNPYFMLEQLGRVLTWVENEYVDPVDRGRLVEGAIKGMVAELDPHSSYLPPEDYSIFQADTDGHFGGVGVEVDFGDDYITIIAPIEGSPAERAGIRSGDRIVAIDNQPVRERSATELVRGMRGEPGTKVLLTIKRPGQEKLLQYRLTRQVITVASVASKPLDRHIAYLRIKTFQTGTHAELLEHVKRLRAAAGGDLAGVILDLRNNPGGLVNEATAVADEFLASGVIFTTRRRGSVVDDVRADSLGALKRGPVAVLVNEYSASAAELVAGALQDNRRAEIVGSPTFGKGSVQTIVDLPGGAGLRLTTLRYYTPSGRAIQAQGVTPGVLVGAASTPFGYGALKERDLDNHLPAVEGAPTPPSGVAEPKDDLPPVGDAPIEGSARDDGAASTSRDVPQNPEKGTDDALRVAYRIVLGTYVAPSRAATSPAPTPSQAPAKAP